MLVGDAGIQRYKSKKQNLFRENQTWDVPRLESAQLNHDVGNALPDVHRREAVTRGWKGTLPVPGVDGNFPT